MQDDQIRYCRKRLRDRGRATDKAKKEEQTAMETRKCAEVRTKRADYKVRLKNRLIDRERLGGYVLKTDLISAIGFLTAWSVCHPPSLPPNVQEQMR